MFKVYVIINKINGYRYIGQTGMTLGRRWRAHRSADRTGALAQAVREFGERSFSIALLCICATREEAEEKERHYVELFQSRTHQQGYNMLPGGPASAAQLGIKHSPEFCAKLSAKLAGKKKTPEHCAGMAAARLGKPLPPETRAKISQSSIGKKHSAESRAKMSEQRRGKSKSPEHRAKLAAILLASHKR